MRVVAVAGAGLQFGEEAVAKVEAATEIGAILAKADGDLFAAFLLLVLAFLVLLALMIPVLFFAMGVPRAGPTWDAVGRVIDADRCAKIAAVSKHREARIGAPGFGRAAGQYTALGCGFAQFFRLFGLFRLFLGSFCQ